MAKQEEFGLIIRIILRMFFGPLKEVWGRCQWSSLKENWAWLINWTKLPGVPTFWCISTLRWISPWRTVKPVMWSNSVLLDATRTAVSWSIHHPCCELMKRRNRKFLLLTLFMISCNWDFSYAFFETLWKNWNALQISYFQKQMIYIYSKVSINQFLYQDWLGTIHWLIHNFIVLCHF